VLCGVESQRVKLRAGHAVLRSMRPRRVRCRRHRRRNPAVCPRSRASTTADGNEDCGGNNICCSRSPAAVPAFRSMQLDVNGAITSLLEAADGGFHLKDAGFVDGGFEDGGFADDFVDGGCKADAASTADRSDVDGGDVRTPEQGPPGPQPDAGSFARRVAERARSGRARVHVELHGLRHLQWASVLHVGSIGRRRHRVLHAGPALPRLDRAVTALHPPSTPPACCRRLVRL